MQLKMDTAALNGFLVDSFPQVAEEFRVDLAEPNRLVLRRTVSEAHLRPGGTVSGPTMFGLADIAAYLVTLSMIGPEALSVTTSCSMDFMRKPAAGCDLLGEARLLKLGKLLSVSDVLIFSDDETGLQGQPVARATLTYAIPPTKRA